MLALDDHCAPPAVDDLLHQHVPTLVGRPRRLADVLVAEVTEDVHHQILKLVAREFVE